MSRKKTKIRATVSEQKPKGNVSEQKPKGNVSELKPKGNVSEQKPIYDPFRTGTMLIVFVTMCIAYIMGIGIIISLKRDGYYDQIKELIASRYGSAYVSATLGGTGWLLYMFKQKQQFWYGVFELGFAFISITVVSSLIHESVQKGMKPDFIIAALSSLYLLVRGATNIADGRGKDFYLKERIEKYV